MHADPGFVETPVSSLWTNLLLLHGHIQNLELVRSLANKPSAPLPARQGGKCKRIHSPLAALQCRMTACIPGLAMTSERRENSSQGPDMSG